MDPSIIERVTLAGPTRPRFEEILRPPKKGAPR